MYRCPASAGHEYINPYLIDGISGLVLNMPTVTDGRCAGEPERRRMMKQIDNILEAAVQSGCTTLWIPVFGCEAHGHPPQEVAKLFREVLRRRGGGVERVTLCISDEHRIHSMARRINEPSHYMKYSLRPCELITS